MKKVGTAMYVHITNVDELYTKLKEEDALFVKNTIANFDKPFAIVKFDTDRVSLIESFDWDSANEPTVGNSYCFSKTKGTMKVIKGTNKIYHNKWVFMAPDYTGFDMVAAKERTTLWNSIPDIKSHKSRIGNKEYWEKLLKANNIPL